MLKSYCPHIALALISVLYLLFGPRQLFFQFCHQMKHHHIAGAPETLFIESVADNFYKAIFFQLNTYKLINHCQPHTWNYYKPFEYLKWIVSTLIKGCSDLDNALIKDLGSKHTAHLHVAFQQKLLGRVSSKSTFALSLFFVALFFKDTIQSGVIGAYNAAYNDFRDWYNNTIAGNNNKNDGGNDGGPDGNSGGNSGGPSGSSGDGPGGNNNAGDSTQRHYSKRLTPQKHLPIPKQPVTKPEASSSKKPSNVASTSKALSNAASSSKDPSSSKNPSPSKDISSSKAPSSSDAPNTDTKDGAVQQALKEYHEASDQFQASFTETNYKKTRLQQSFTRYEGLVNGLKKDYNPKLDIPLPDITFPTIDQYLVTQEEVGAKLRDIAKLKGKSTPLLDDLTNHLRIARLKTDELEKKLYDWKFDREPYVLLTAETISQVPPVHDSLPTIPSTAPPPESPASFVDSPTWSQLQEQQQVKPETPYPYPNPSPYAPGAKKHFKTEKEAKEYLKNHPVYETTFEDVDYVDVPFYVGMPPEEYENYRFPPGEYVAPLMNPEVPSTSAAPIVNLEALPTQTQVPKSSKSKGKQPMHPRA